MRFFSIILIIADPITTPSAVWQISLAWFTFFIPNPITIGRFVFTFTLFIDFFIYDTKNYYTIRLISDIVILDNDVYINYLNIQSGSNSAILDKYDIKHNSSGILFDADMFHDNLSDIFDNYYKNNLKL